MNGRLDFNNKLKDLGGIENIARDTYARNMWLIMKDFHTLPSSDGTWGGLRSSQISFILAEYDIDYREQEAAAKGQSTESDTFFDDDNNWYDHPDQYDFSQTDEEVEDTRKQILAMSDTSTKRTIEENLDRLKRVYDTQEHQSDVEKANAQVDSRIDDMYAMLAQYGNNQEEIQTYRKALRNHTIDNETETEKDARRGTAQENAEDILKRLNGDE